MTSIAPAYRFKHFTLPSFPAVPCYDAHYAEVLGVALSLTRWNKGYAMQDGCDRGRLWGAASAGPGGV